MARRFLSLLLAAFLLSPPLPLQGASAISLNVNPHVCFPECDISVQVRVTSHPPKAYAQVIIDGPDYFALNKTPLPEKQTILLPAIPYRGLGTGTYTVSAQIVVGEDESEERVIDEVTEMVTVAGEDGI